MNVSAEWRELLSLLPGYDPFAQADGCWFDPDLAQLYLDFFPSCLTHVEGALVGKPFELALWQKSYVANLFGWLMNDEIGRIVRRFRESLLYVPRKNGKTPLGAGIGLAVLSIDEEAGQQDYIGADRRETAGKLFRHVKGMVLGESELSKRYRIYGGKAEAGQSRSIVYEGDGSFLRVISADAKGEHGGNTHLAIVDELHTQPNRDLIDVLQTSTASLNRPQPLLIWITTADFQRESICNEKHAKACAVRDNSQDSTVGINDQRFLPAIWEATEKDDWRSPETWKKANPNLGVSVSLAYLERECKTACETPSYENTFRRLHLNQKTEQECRAIEMVLWSACAHGVEDPVAWRRYMIRVLQGHNCFGGLDLGSTSDLSALGLVFPELKPIVLLPYFWATRKAIQLRKKTRIPFDVWERQGFLVATDGDVTDYDVVRRDVGELANWFALRELAVDRVFQGVQLCTQLKGDGITVIAFAQSFLNFAAPTKRVLELIAQAGFATGANPMLGWMAGNASTEEDVNGNLKFSKAASGDKIDGLVALTMAHARAEATAEMTDGGCDSW